MKAIVLCAGSGTRLGSLTRTTPKSMLPLCGRPLLAYTLSYLSDQGFDQIAINLHYLPEQITQYFGDGTQFGVNIHYSYEPDLLGTAGAVKKLETWFSDADDFLVMYGDILTDQVLSAMWDFHLRNKPLATILLHQRSDSNSLVQMDKDGRITNFIERPSEEVHQALQYPWVHSGIGFLNRRALDYIPPEKPFDLPRNLYAPLVSKERLFGFPLTGFRCAIDSPERYTQAENAIALGIYKGRSIQ